MVNARRLQGVIMRARFAFFSAVAMSFSLCATAPPVSAAGAPVALAQLSVGNNFVCGLIGANPVCWGSEIAGGGDMAAVPSGLGPVTQIDADWQTACALTVANTVRCWGYEYADEVNWAATQVDVRAVTVSGAVVCVLLGNEKSLACAGVNQHGQSSSPVLSHVKKVAGAGWHTCALAGDAVNCWGWNHMGQLASDRRSYSDVAAESDTSCGRRVSDGMWECWGQNEGGQLSVPSVAFDKLALSWYGACGLKSANLTCWGRLPGALSRTSGILDVAASRDVVCVETQTGDVDCTDPSLNRSAATISTLASARPRASLKPTVVATGLGWAAGMDRAPNGQIAVASYSQNQVTIIDGQTVARTFSGFKRPIDVAYDATGNLYVACMGRDIGISSIDRILAGSDVVEHQWRTGFVGASGVDFDSEGRLWVSDADGNALYRQTADGSLVSAGGPWPFDHVHEIRLDGQGNLFLPGMQSGAVFKRTPDGSITTLSRNMRYPSAVAPDGRGGVFFADRDTGRVSNADADGTVSTVATGLLIPHGLLLIGGTLLVATWDDSSSVLGYDLRQVSTAPRSVTAVASDSRVQVSWQTPEDDGRDPNLNYTVTASPGGQSCNTTGLNCIVAGLSNRRSYSFTVTATNFAGTSDPSAPTDLVMPLAPGFQTWSDDAVVAVGSSTTL
ncbi:MAG: fibronectin type III domain-containing protein, partial [Actinomycetales bacterium]|nr:fibronectin type III domain-containing protein [Actinomycetales bacterium]